MDTALDDYLQHANPRRLFWDSFWPEAQRAGVSRETAAGWCRANTQRIDRDGATVMGCIDLTQAALSEIKEERHGY
jgi:hypothetical protein